MSNVVQPVLLSGPDVWMEGEATHQLAAVCGVEGCVHVAGMPDLHPGRGFPIGAVVATRDVVHPRLVGGDAGCGARVVATSVTRVNPDQLERRLRDAFAVESQAPLAQAGPFTRTLDAGEWAWDILRARGARVMLLDLAFRPAPAAAR